MARKTKKKKVAPRRSRLMRWLPGLLFFVGLAFMTASGAHWYLRYRSLSLNSQVVAAYEETTQIVAPAPTHINIPWKVDVGIELAAIYDGKVGISEKQASYLLQSARPGENGNIIIYGHNKREIMGNIRAVQGGEIVTLTTADGSEHRYRVTEFAEVSPEQTEYLEPTETEVLTLYTCSGLFDSQRFIVRAVPVELS